MIHIIAIMIHQKPFLWISYFFHNWNHDNINIAITHNTKPNKLNTFKLSPKYQAHAASKVNDVINLILTKDKLESAYFKAASIHIGIIKSKTPAGIEINISFCVIFLSQTIKKLMRKNNIYNIKHVDKNTSLSYFFNVISFFI